MSSNYSEEHYNPTLAPCATLALHFNGKKLKMTGGRKDYNYSDVSGRRLEDGRFNHSQEAQRTKFSGPIPEWKYWIRPDELRERTWIKNLFLRLATGERRAERHEQGWGNHRITIHPFTTTKTYQRGGFFIHRGKVPGSAGCIDLTAQMSRFVDDLKKETALRKCQIHLTIDYFEK